jgi:hypothetical protein
MWCRQRMLTKQVPGADRRVRNPTGVRFPPEIPAPNPNLSFPSPELRRPTNLPIAAGRPLDARCAVKEPTGAHHPADNRQAQRS